MEKKLTKPWNYLAYPKREDLNMSVSHYVFLARDGERISPGHTIVRLHRSLRRIRRRGSSGPPSNN